MRAGLIFLRNRVIYIFCRFRSFRERPQFARGRRPGRQDASPCQECYGAMSEKPTVEARRPGADGTSPPPAPRLRPAASTRGEPRRNVFVFGLDDFNRELLERFPGSDRYNFVGLVGPDAVDDPAIYSVRDLLAQAEAQLEAFQGTIDAIVGYIDIPVGTILPILCRKYGVPSPTLESVLKCQHKYWSRVEQARVVPEHIPRFSRFDPFHPDPLSGIDLEFPFWIKPVKSAGSYLGFRVDSEEQFRQKLEVIRAEIGRLSEPFNYLMGFADLPREVTAVDCHYCIAEEIIGGRQCTLEGFVYRGEVVVYGVIDSVPYPGSSSFARYQYPSRIPAGIQRRMARIAERVIRQVGLDDSVFNIELFWDEDKDRIWLLEINTRISQSHSDLFFNVDGVSNHKAMVEIALGRRPETPKGLGSFATAAKFYLRRFADARVEAVPSAADLAAVRRRFPEARTRINARAGMRLSELVEQDSYSFDLAWIFLGGEDTAGLLAKYEEAVGMLPFRFSE